MIESDVLVVGGGPAGSSVAFALARAGISVHIVDRAHFPRPKPCAEYLSPEASRIMAAMGALEVASVVVAVRAETMPVLKVPIMMRAIRRTLAAENAIVGIFIHWH